MTEPSWSELARDVARGFASRPKELPPKWFYDELGSRLFDAICGLPWYRITRAELPLLRRAAPGALPPERRSLVELGPGTGEKLAALVRAAPQRGPLTAHLVDISQAALDGACRALASLPDVTPVAHRATFEEGLSLIAARRDPLGSRLVLFLGSNIGNLDRQSAVGFLSTVRKTLAPGDALLLGADLVKDERDLVLAYDDPLGVTAAFNKNLLLRLNRELGADFALDDFAHEARWNRSESRVEMHLVARRALLATVPGAGLEVSFDSGESIFTESSYKYELPSLGSLVESAGFASRDSWVDEAARYALLLFGTA